MSGRPFLLGIAVSLLSAAGCARIGYERERPIAPPHAGFQVGTTDYDDVMQALGPPPRLSANPTGFTFLYEHVSVEERQLGVSSEKLFATLGLGPSAPGGFNLGSAIRLLYAWAEADIETLVLEFDHGGALRTASYERADTDLGSTFGISFIFSTERKLGLEDYEVQPAALSWGLRLTEEAKRQLNRAQDLSTGRSGVARRPANFSVGQDVTLPQSDLTRLRKKIDERR